MPPSSRAGFSVCVHKKRALLFGGVVDMEMEGQEMIISLFPFSFLSSWIIIDLCDLLAQVM